MVIGNFAFSEKSNKKITYCSHFVSIGDHRTHGDTKPHAENMMNIHKHTQKNIEKATTRYQQKENKHTSATPEIQIGEMVWIHLRKERFPKQKKNKLMPRVDRPFEIT